jgi:hypothetical protein
MRSSVPDPNPDLNPDPDPRRIHVFFGLPDPDPKNLETYYFVTLFDF